MRLKNRTAIVTGSGQGIGREIALALAREGAKVVIVARSEKVFDTLKEVQGVGADAIAIRTDVASRQQTEEMAKEALARFGSIDILVNNAGKMPNVPLVDMDESQWDEIINTNLKGVFNCTKAVLPTMIAQKCGSIINIASLSGAVIGFSKGTAHYASSKGGVLGFTRAAAVELGTFGIRVNAVAPGVISTESLMSMPGMEDYANVLPLMIPLGRLGKPAEIAGPVVFLASDESSYMTGQLMVVDGGLSNQ